MRHLRPLWLAAGFALAPLCSPLLAQTNQLVVELNKFDIAEDGSCRAFFLFRNGTGKSFSGFELSLAVLNREGIIDQLLSIDAAPLPAGRTTLKLFEIPEIGCADISQILLHDMPLCQPQNEDAMDCFPILDLVSRTATGLVK